MYNKEMILESFGSNFLEENNERGQMIFKFENGYGVSLINHRGSYGNEIAVLKFEENGMWDINYNTPITNDVLGHLDDSEILETLQQVKNLHPIY